MSFRYLVLLFCLIPLVSSAQPEYEKTEILILGTTHLRQVENFKPAMIAPVLKRLDDMDFDAICIEKTPAQIMYDIESREDSIFRVRMLGRAYLELADTVQRELGITYLEAERNIDSLLQSPTLKNTDRKQLLYNFMAATDLPSAVLQLMYIGETEKNLFRSDFDRYLVGKLRAAMESGNEYFSLAGRLAQREGINRLEAIDNFQDEALLNKYYPEFGQEFAADPEMVKKVMSAPVFQKTQQLTEQGTASGDLSRLYTFMNSEEFVRQDYEAQWQLWLRTRFPSGSDRARFSLWEMRNLQIAANILHVIARHPRKRLLVVIGASHKGFLEKYLRQIEDLRLLTYE